MKLLLAEFLRVFLWWLTFLLIIMVKYLCKASCTAYEHKHVYVDIELSWFFWIFFKNTH